MAALELVVDVLAVLAGLGLVVGVAVGVRDLAGECLAPLERTDPPAGFVVLPRRPFDFERDG